MVHAFHPWKRCRFRIRRIRPRTNVPHRHCGGDRGHARRAPVGDHRVDRKSGSGRVSYDAFVSPPPPLTLLVFRPDRDTDRVSITGAISDRVSSGLDDCREMLIRVVRSLDPPACDYSIPWSGRHLMGIGSPASETSIVCFPSTHIILYVMHRKIERHQVPSANAFFSE